MRKELFIAVAAVLIVGCKAKKAAVNSAGSYYKSQQELLDGSKSDYGADVERGEDGLRITLNAGILFRNNSSILTDTAKRRIKDLVGVLESKGYPQVRVEGHTDLTGTAEYNKWLSDRRAASVRKYAVSLGFPEKSIEAVGLGATKPVADNRTAEGRRKNRRVEILILDEQN